MTSVFSWQNAVSLCSASFRIPRPNLPVTPGVSWLPTLAFQSPIMKRTSSGGVSSRRSCNLHRTVQLQLLQHYCLGHRLRLPWYWMIRLENEQRSFCRFWDCIQVLHFAVAALCLNSCEEIPHVQGKRKPSKMVGTERGHQRADRLKPQSQTSGQSDHVDYTLV